MAYICLVADVTPMGTRGALTALIEGWLASSAGRSELIALATGLIIEEGEEQGAGHRAETEH